MPNIRPFLIIILLFLLLAISLGQADISEDGTEPMNTSDLVSKVQTRKVLVEVILDYDYGGHNSRHEPRRGKSGNGVFGSPTDASRPVGAGDDRRSSSTNQHDAISPPISCDRTLVGRSIRLFYKGESTRPGHLRRNMTCTRRWVVTYTKHLKQKRKTYHDGVLEISDSGNKVLLYDDSEKLIDSRFLKKDEVIESGGTLTFEAHLVDIGNLQKKGSFKNLNSSRNDSKSSEKAQNLPQKENERSMHHNKLAQKYLSGTNCKSRVNKTEPDSLGAKETRDITHSDPKEWNVLYTTQISQKAKKYHDGVLRLSLCGSHMNQIMLLSEDGLVLSSKYLKSVESLRTGSKCELPNHLVEICEPRTPCEEDLQKLPSKQLMSSSSSSNKSTRTSLITKDSCNTHLEQAGGSCSSDSVKSADSSREQSNKPLRDACQILRTLKKPFPFEKDDPRNSPVAHANVSPSLDFVLPDAQCQSKDLNLQGGGNHKGDFSEYASQTSLLGTPDIRWTSSQQVIHTEPKLEVDSPAIATSVEGHNTSDHSSV
ncbi:hypothetical protein OPV22_015749 [Ensete ventricosum]|uniref:5'-3' DNA helicase ZGRF1-like N-terminal domain-containing protein n=1 Tax=Ensete ventricosum TaxID=4639 RepID=A0AAV8R669_ENSVE|nr:hypothetical protein OPV22_015749 [Ensete ventricosum]